MSMIEIFDEMLKFINENDLEDRSMLLSRVIRVCIEYGIFTKSTDNIEEIFYYHSKTKNPKMDIIIDYINKIIIASKNLDLTKEIKVDKIPPWVEGKKYDKIAMNLSIKVHYPMMGTFRIEINKSTLEKIITEYNRKNLMEFAFSAIYSFFIEHNIDGRIISLFSNPALRYDFDDIQDDTLIVFQNRSKLFLPYMIDDYIPYICRKRRNITFAILISSYNEPMSWIIKNDFYFGDIILDNKFRLLLYRN